MGRELPDRAAAAFAESGIQLKKRTVLQRSAAARKKASLYRAALALLCICLGLEAAGCAAKGTRTAASSQGRQQGPAAPAAVSADESVAPSQAAQVPAQSIALDKSSLTMKVGDTAPLAAAVQPDDATDKSVVWSSSDIYTVSHDSAGQIKAERAGSAIIYAKTANGLQAKCSVTVTDPAAPAAPTPSSKPAASSVPAAAPAAPATRAKSFHGAAFGSSNQVIVVTAGSMNTISATLATYQKTGGTWNKVLSVDARVGKNGLVYDSERIEGDLKTPVGVYSLPYAFGTAADPGTKLPYKPIDSNTYYDGQYGSPTYNDLVEGKPDNDESEHMDIGPYQYGLDIAFNPEQKAGKGNAIFLHCSTDSGYTAGCVSISPGDIVKLLQWIDPAQNPQILICPTGNLANYYS